MQTIALQAKVASRKVALIDAGIKSKALLKLADTLLDKTSDIIQANKKDILGARENNLSAAIIDRLTLDDRRIQVMAQAVREIAEFPDPVGEVIEEKLRPNGLKLKKVRVPLGVIAFIYESRPNVTTDAAAIALKAGSSIVLRGGKEAVNSNMILVKLIRQVLKEEGVPEDAVQLITDLDYARVTELLLLREYIDLVIPRGGKNLIKAVTANATMPVLKHFEGICHTYVDQYADCDKALNICFNAKVSRPGVCNAMETLLVHEAIAEQFIPQIIDMLSTAGVEIRACRKTKNYVHPLEFPDLVLKDAVEEDWRTEYLDLILSIKTVRSLEEAIQHIDKYGSGHSECIVSENKDVIKKFLREIDAAAVFANASTRFHDGGEFGLGAEMGISTDKFHARGPVGIRELMSYKWVVEGDGQIRD